MKKSGVLLLLLAAATVCCAQTYWGTDGTWKTPHFTGATLALGGGALTVGTCTTGTATVTGATTAMTAIASPAANPGASMGWYAFISAANTVTVKVCALLAGTPTSTTYNVKVLQ
jgi:hypothetical protein